MVRRILAKIRSQLEEPIMDFRSQGIVDLVAREVVAAIVVVAIVIAAVAGLLFWVTS